MTARSGTLLWLPAILDAADLDPTETLLMVALADHVGSDDSCFVGIDRLAARARVSYGTARRRLAALEKRGVIERDRRRRDDGNLSVYAYVLQRDPFGLPRNVGASDDPPPRTLTRADQRAPRRAVTTAHPDARAEVPRVEPPRVEPPTARAPQLELVTDDPRHDPAYRFDDFWQLYPKRKGRRVGRAKTLERWRRLPYDDKAAAFRGAHHYRADCDADLTIAKDADRWLRDRCWEDWQEPTAAGAAGATTNRERRLVRRGPEAVARYLEAAGALPDHDAPPALGTGEP